MRIIAGQYKGRPLATPKGQTTRPTADRVKEALFSMLQARLPQSRVLDLFAGTGALGLESLSRGAAHATLVEKRPEALAVLKKNIQSLGAGERCRVLGQDAFAALDLLQANGERFDIIFLDPPYGPEPMQSALARCLTMITPDGVICVEHPAGEGPMLADSPMWPERRYGNTALTLIQGGPST